MTDIVPIDPSRPVAGNWRGTYVGAIAFSIAGYVANLGVFAKATALLYNDAFSSMFSAQEMETTLAFGFAGLVGFGINYLVTHWTQAKNLLDLYREYQSAPEVFDVGIVAKNAGSSTGKK